MPLPSGLLIEVAFDNGARDAASILVWTDITARAMAFTASRGRSAETTLCEPGTTNVVLLNNDGLFDSFNTSSVYFNKIVPNRRLRISALDNGSVRRYISTTYADTWDRSWPGGFKYSVCEYKGTDRFKLLAKRQNSLTTVREQAHLRIKAILDNGTANSATSIIPTAEYSLNPDAYACRTLVPHIYTESNTLDNLKEIAQSDGGAMFINPLGVLVFQSTRFRSDNVRSTTPQAVFGNAYTATVPLSRLNPPKLLNDDVRLSNYIRVTDGQGTEKIAQNAPSIAKYDRYEFDIGGTLLQPGDAQDRVDDVLVLRQEFAPRYEELTIDCYGSNAALQQALLREISDAITIANVPAGQRSGTTQAYYIEGISHDVTVTSWLTTFRLSPVGVSTQIGPTAPVAPTMASTATANTFSTSPAFTLTYPAPPPVGSTLLVGIHCQPGKKVTQLSGAGAQWQQVSEKIGATGITQQVWAGYASDGTGTINVTTTAGAQGVAVQAAAAQKPLFVLKKPDSTIAAGTSIPVTTGSATIGEYIFSVTGGTFAGGVAPGTAPTFVDTPSAWSGHSAQYYDTNLAVSIEFTTVPATSTNWQRTYTYPVTISNATNTKVVFSG